MPDPIHITSPSNPRVKAVARLRRRSGRRKEKRFVAEGWREVTRAIDAGLAVDEVYLCPELVESVSSVLNSDAPRFTVAADAFVKMTYRQDPEGVLAVVREPGWSLEALPPVTTDTLYLVAVGTEKPGNLGAMVRTAAAAGCDAVLAADVPGITVDPFNPNAIRASTGAVFGLPTISAPETEVLAHLKQHGLRLVAATPAADAIYTDADWAGPLAIVIGPEDRGLSDAWLDAADQRVAIPVRGRLVDSLNAANAAAVLLYEAVRRHRALPPSGRKPG